MIPTTDHRDVHEALLEVPGGQVFTRHWMVPDSDLSPIVLLHDSLGSVELWRDFPAHLAATTGRTVIAYDRLGYGHSTPRTEPETARLVDDEAISRFPHVANALGLDRYVLFGHSIGAGMALTIAAHDVRCQAVISESAQAFVEQRTLDGIAAAQAEFERPGRLARLERWHGRRARWVLDAWADVWLNEEFRLWSLHRLTDVTCPVLVIHGDTDEYGSLAFPETIAASVAGPVHVTIIHTGHLPHREAETTVLHAVRSFLDQHAHNAPRTGP